MFVHSAFGLSIFSPFPLPEFLPGSITQCDVTIRLADRYFVPTDAVQHQTYLKFVGNEAVYFVPSVGLFQIRHGREVVINPAPGVEQDVEQLRLYVSGAVMAIVLYQRGMLVLHASVVAVKGTAVAFLGNSGWGKSSTAAALHKRGHMIISDDLLVIDFQNEQPMVYPAFPQFKIDLQVASVLNFDQATLFQLHPHEPKRGCRIDHDFPVEPIPLKHIYVLGLGETNQIEPCRSQEAIIELIRHSFVKQKSAAAGHLQKCVRLAQKAPVFRLNRTQSLAALPHLAEFTENHMLTCQFAVV